LIPFLQQIPITERDEHLGDKLKAEASGILNWMLQGLKAWQADGRKLNEPREVCEAVGEYRTDSDTFGSFLCDCIEPNDFAKVAVSSAYANYCSWADSNGSQFKLTKIEFGKTMAERGYKTKPFHGERKFIGCSIIVPSKADMTADDTTADDTADDATAKPTADAVRKVTYDEWVQGAEARAKADAAVNDDRKF